MSSRSFYKRKPIDSLGRKAWTDKEDRLLCEAMKREGLGHWTEISKAVAGRTPDACRKRWEKVLDPGIKKGTWLSEEDAILYALVSRHGAKRWTLIASQIPGRTDKQCRQRWFDNLAGNAPEDAISKGRELLEKMLATSLPRTPALTPKFKGSCTSDAPVFENLTSHDITHSGKRHSSQSPLADSLVFEGSCKRIKYYETLKPRFSCSETEIIKTPTYRSVFSEFDESRCGNAGIGCDNFNATPKGLQQEGSILEYNGTSVKPLSYSGFRVSLPPLHESIDSYPVLEKNFDFQRSTVPPLQFGDNITLPSLSNFTVSHSIQLQQY